MAHGAEAEGAAAVAAEKPQGWQEAEKRRRRQDAAYLRRHQERLEMVATRCVNQVLVSRPPDPYFAMLDMLDAHTKDGICFGPLRVLSSCPDAVCIEVVARVRGSTMAVHRTELPKALAARALGGLAEQEDVEALEALPAARVASLLRGAAATAFAGTPFLNFGELRRRLAEALPAAPAAAEAPAEPRSSIGSRAAPQEGGVPPVDLLRNAVGTALLQAGGRLLNTSASEAVRAGLATRTGLAAPPLNCRADLAAWRCQWPELLAPALQGPTLRRRFFVGLSLWSSTLKEAAGMGLEPPLLVDAEAAKCRQEAEGKEPFDEPEPDEFCPPLNAVAIAGGLASAMLDKVRSASLGVPGDAADGKKDKKGAAKAKAEPKAKAKAGNPEPAAQDAPTTPAMLDGGDLAASLACLQRVLQESLPGYMAAQRTPADEGIDAREPAGALQRGCVYLALHADADAAFDTESGGYTLIVGGPSRTQGEMVDLYAQLCESEPLLTTLVAPLSPRDEEYAAGIAALRERLPLGVAILEEGAADSIDGGTRDLRATALGLAAEHQQGSTAFVGKDGLYDFGVDPELFAQAASYVDVSLALPERSRRLVLPGPRPEGLVASLAPLSAQLQELIQSVYGREHPSDGREKKDGLTLAQFREGLRRTGFADADRVEPLFYLLDTRNSGFLSVEDLGALEHVRGHASLQELDEFRAWLCAWEVQQRKGDLNPAEDSPVASLWRRLGPYDGTWSFSEFKRAMHKTAKYPVGPENSGHLHELFACLDGRSSSAIAEAEFMRLNVFSARNRLDRVCDVWDFMRERFGSSHGGFQAVDEPRAGTVGLEVFADVMVSQHGYLSKEDVRATFQFINIHRTNAVSSKDFEVLETLDADRFLADVASLKDCLEQRHGSLRSAFQKFIDEATTAAVEEGRFSRSRATSRVATADTRSHTPGSSTSAGKNRRPKVSLDPQEFLAGCRASGYQGSYDCRYIFNFLDTAYAGKMGASDFVLLGELDAIDRLERASKPMHSTIAAVKAFAFAGTDAFGAEGEADGKNTWASLHAQLRAATHHDLFA